MAGKKETILDEIKRMGTKAFADEATRLKINSSLRRESKKTGQYVFQFNKGGQVKYYKDIM